MVATKTKWKKGNYSKGYCWNHMYINTQKLNFTLWNLEKCKLHEKIITQTLATVWFKLVEFNTNLVNVWIHICHCMNLSQPVHPWYVHPSAVHIKTDDLMLRWISPEEMSGGGRCPCPRINHLLNYYSGPVVFFYSLHKFTIVKIFLNEINFPA